MWEQGDLTDPSYFDFITFAQLATITREMQQGRQQFEVLCLCLLLLWAEHTQLRAAVMRPVSCSHKHIASGIGTQVLSGGRLLLWADLHHNLSLVQQVL